MTVTYDLFKQSGQAFYHYPDPLQAKLRIDREGYCYLLDIFF